MKWFKNIQSTIALIIKRKVSKVFGNIVAEVTEEMICTIGNAAMEAPVQKLFQDIVAVLENNKEGISRLKYYVGNFTNYVSALDKTPLPELDGMTDELEVIWDEDE